MLPPSGVYLSRTKTGGKWYQSVTDIAKQESEEGEILYLETCLFGCPQDLYGPDASVELLSFRRPQRRFASGEELKEQILHDIADAGDCFRNYPASS